MESSDNKQNEKEETKSTTNQTNPSTDSEAKSVANLTKNNESEIKKSQEIVKEVDSDNDDEKIKLVFDDDDDEDIPGDFFDDFLKEDFMAGLDIVDDDDWNEEDKSVSASKTNHKPAPKESPVKPKKVNKNEECNAKSKRSAEKVNKNEECNAKSKRSAEVTESNEYDGRRDPKKTRRDIERDKERCEKDKEKKIISEKLQLVETGLVPPGTEMEIDMEEIKKQKKDLDHKVKNPVKSLSKSPKRKRTSRSPKDEKNSKKLSPRRKRTPLRKIGEFHKTSPMSKTSPRHVINPKSIPVVPRDDRSLRRSRSPYPRRGRYSPTPADRRRTSPRRRSSDRRRTPERDSYSRRRRSRSRSPKRRRADKKKSFLQEIAEKLNETRPMMVQPMMMGPMPQMMPPYHQEMHYMPEHMQMMPEPMHMMPEPMHMMPEPMQMAPNQMMPNPMMHTPVPAVVPAPVPAPVPPPTVNLYKPPEQNFDQSFFIGTPAQQTPVQNSTADNSQLPKTAPKQNATPASNAVNEKTPASEPNKTKGELSDLTKNIIDKLNKTTNDIPKLFQDKKISLSEFLAITAKPEVVASSPANLKEKIKVISRCQDAISYLGTSDKKFSGRLVIRKTKKNPPSQPIGNYRSPLVAKQPKIPFTEIPSKSEIESSFSSYINRLLRHIGLLDDVAVDVENYSEKDGAKTSPGKAETPPAPPPPPQISKPKRSSESVRKKESPKASRGETSRCVECERRARKTFKTSGVQCSQDSIKYSVSTQFPEEDHSMKFPKNQSLASLTPAQLLANSVPATSRFKDEFDVYGRGRGMPPMQSNDLNYRPRYQPFF